MHSAAMPAGEPPVGEQSVVLAITRSHGVVVLHPLACSHTHTHTHTHTNTRTRQVRSRKTCGPCSYRLININGQRQRNSKPSVVVEARSLSQSIAITRLLFLANSPPFRSLTKFRERATSTLTVCTNRVPITYTQLSIRTDVTRADLSFLFFRLPTMFARSPQRRRFY